MDREKLLNIINKKYEYKTDKIYDRDELYDHLTDWMEELCENGFILETKEIEEMIDDMVEEDDEEYYDYN